MVKIQVTILSDGKGILMIGLEKQVAETPFLFNLQDGDLTRTVVIGSTGQGVNFNPVADFAKNADLSMRLLQQVSNFELDMLSINLAKQIGVQLKIAKPTSILDLVTAWKADPALAEFAEAVAKAMLPN